MSEKQITRDNWGYPPFNRDSFQDVQSLFPTARLKRGFAGASEIPVGLKPLKTIEFENLEGNKQSIGEMLHATYTDAFLVLKDGVLVYEEYLNDMEADTLHLLNSVTKSFVGMLAGVLYENGVIDPDKYLSDYIPEFKDTVFSLTTLQHALDMSAAVEYGEDYADPKADFWHEAAVVGWRPHLLNAESPDTLFDYALALRDREKQQLDGEKFHYRTVLTNIVAMAIERATGERCQDLIEKYIWEKLRPEQDAVIVVDKTGFPYVGAGMNACARDLARFGLMLLNDGNYNGEQIIPAAWVRATREADEGYRDRFAKSDYGMILPGGHYKNQVWVANIHNMLCIGIHGQLIYIDQSNGLVIVKLSSWPESHDDFLLATTVLGIDAISASFES